MGLRGPKGVCSRKSQICLTLPGCFLTVCYFYDDNYPLRVYRHPVFDVTIYEPTTPIRTFHLKIFEDGDSFYSEEAN